MGIVDSKTFKSGNSVAVRLPKEIAFAPDTRVTIERNGDALTIRPAVDPADERRRLEAMLAAMAAIGRPDDSQDRENVRLEFPDRPGF